MSEEVDQIYHLACPASPVHDQRTSVQAIETCVPGSVNLPGLAKRTSTPALLSSTLEVHGDPGDGPQTGSSRCVADMVDGHIRLLITGHELTGPTNPGTRPPELAAVQLLGGGAGSDGPGTAVPDLVERGCAG